MRISGVNPGRLIKWTQRCGRGIAILWAAFWFVFGIANSAVDGDPWPLVILHAALPGAFFAALALLACWRSRGGNILVMAATLSGAAYAGFMSHAGLASLAPALLFLSGPPLLAGLLLEFSVVNATRTFRPAPARQTSDSSSHLHSAIR
jgi:hypothetical protein